MIYFDKKTKFLVVGFTIWGTFCVGAAVGVGTGAWTGCARSVRAGPTLEAWWGPSSEGWGGHVLRGWRVTSGGALGFEAGASGPGTTAVGVASVAPSPR